MLELSKNKGDKRTDRDHLAAILSDMLSDLFYYNRKECEHMPVGAIEEMVENGEVTVDEIIDFVNAGIRDALKHEISRRECMENHHQRRSGCSIMDCLFFVEDLQDNNDL